MNKETPMKWWMPPREYIFLVYKGLFKIISLDEESEKFSKSEVYKFLLSNITFALLIAIIYSLIIEVFFSKFQFNLSIKICAILIVLLSFLVFFLRFNFSNKASVGRLIFASVFFSLITPLIILSVEFEFFIESSSQFKIFIALWGGFIIGIFLGGYREDDISGQLITFVGCLALGIYIIRERDVIFGAFYLISYFIFATRVFYFPVYWYENANSSTNPLRWDENLQFPVPFFLQLFLFYAHRDGLYSTVNLATFLIENRPVHRNLAKRALIKLAAHVMERFSTLNQIAYLQNELDFMPPAKKMPEDYEAALKDLTVIAEDVQKTYEEKNRTNQQRQYQRIEQAIRDFQRKSNASKLRSYVQFRLVGRTWLGIIQREIHRLESIHGKKLPNPFITGDPIQPQDEEIFVGRMDIIDKIQTEALREGATGAILFTGNRRTGKSSTLLNLNRFLLSNLKAVYFDCQYPKMNTSLPIFCQYFAQEIIKKLPALKERALPTDLVALTEWLEAVEETLQKEGRYLLLCIDEYERLGKLINDGTLRGLADALRSWVQRFRHITFLFAGSHEMKELNDIDWTDYLINVRTVYISYLEEPAALHLVTKPVPEFDLQYQPDTLPQELVQRLGRQPYLLQCTMSEMVEDLNNHGNRKIAELKDIDHAIEQVFTTAQQYFEHFWERELEEEARTLLLRLAKGKSVETDTAIAKRLVRKEVLRRVNGQLVFCVPVLQEWIVAYY